jgi:N-terminal acetyltransferase B complex non-catalytic subunit
MRILIAKLFIRCGAVGAALESLRGLDLKHIQLESLGYIYIWKLIRCGFMIEGYRILHQIEHFYNTYEKESMEHILSAYKYGSWEKILEFMDFRTILLRSGQFATVKVERRLLEYHRDAGSRADLQRIIETIKREAHLENSFLKNWDVLTDNRDLGVIAETGVKKHPKLVEWGASTFIADKKKLKVRGYLLTLINHCALLIDNSTGEDELKDLQAKIEDTHSKLAEEITITGKEFEQEDIQSITGPWPSRIAEYAQAGYCQLLLKFSSLVISLLKDSGNPESNSVLVESSAKIRQDLEGMVNQRLTAWKKFQSRKNLLDFSEVLENGYDLIETLSFACVFLDVISFVLLKNAANVNQKSRKKKGKVTTMDTSHYSHFFDLLTIVSESLVKIENELRETTHLLIQNVSSKWENLDGFWKGRVDPELYTRIICYSMPTILFKFSESYYNSLQEISANIASKTNYLDTIRAQF